MTEHVMPPRYKSITFYHKYCMNCDCLISATSTKIRTNEGFPKPMFKVLCKWDVCKILYEA